MPIFLRGYSVSSSTTILENVPKVDCCQKFVPNFYGHYIVINHMGLVAYKLSLPNHSKLHPFFHVSYLNKVIGSKFQIQTTPLEFDEEGSIWLHPQVIWSQH